MSLSKAVRAHSIAWIAVVFVLPSSPGSIRHCCKTRSQNRRIRYILVSNYLKEVNDLAVEQPRENVGMDFVEWLLQQLDDALHPSLACKKHDHFLHPARVAVNELRCLLEESAQVGTKWSGRSNLLRDVVSPIPEHCLSIARIGHMAWITGTGRNRYQLYYASFTLEVWIFYVGILATVAVLALTKLEEMTWLSGLVSVKTLLLRIM
ncbi:hypothetical protein KC340_g84 [Hortaea werneckii]|nr:hypothetical protein KC340_g84 [Hortaea werneckii]